MEQLNNQKKPFLSRNASTSLNQKKLTGSVFIQAYSDFNYRAFLSTFRTTRFSIFRNNTQDMLFCAIAFSDAYFTKESFEEVLKRWNSEIKEMRYFRTWKECNTVLSKHVSHEQLDLLEGKKYVAGKRNKEE